MLRTSSTTALKFARLLTAAIALSLMLINGFGWFLSPGKTDLNHGLELTQAQANIELLPVRKPNVEQTTSPDGVPVSQSKGNPSPPFAILCFHTNEWVAPEACSNRIPADKLSMIGPLSGIGFVVYNDSTGEIDSGKFVKYERIFLVPSVNAKHSMHSLLRTIEVVAFNDHPGKDLQLCTGTRKLLDSKYCSITRRLEALFSGRYRITAVANPQDAENPEYVKQPIVGPDTDLLRIVDIERSIRWSALFIGWIQFLTTVLFSFLLIRTLSKYFASFVETPKLKTITFSDEEIVKQDSEIARITASGGHIQDRLYLAGLLSDSAQEARQRIYDKKVHLVELFDKGLDGARVQSENMLKLAFVGTILGISGALYAARNLDTANPIEKILVKSEMFSQIGAAFGTTLVGVVLSIAIVTIVESLSSRSHRIAAEAYDRIFNSLSGTFSIASLPEDTKKHIEKLNDDPEDQGVLARTGGVVFLLILLGIGYWVIRNWGSIL